jgi:NAD(P)-dependent dehydrogenase (short-subunit alcohol dehydrogenase family)
MWVSEMAFELNDRADKLQASNRKLEAKEATRREAREVVGQAEYGLPREDVEVLDLTRPMATITYDDVAVDDSMRLAGQDATGALHRAIAVGCVMLASEQIGGADLLVNNTGINPVYGPMIELDLDAARKIVEVNCLAALSWAQQAHREWMSEHGGAIVNVASVGGIRPAPGIGFYGASKAMLIHITEELAVELGPDIRVNAVAPAVVKTNFAAKLYEGREDEAAAAYPLKRLGVPSDVGSVVAFLLSGDAAWMTGQLLVIDGGVTLAGGVE